MILRPSSKHRQTNGRWDGIVGKDSPIKSVHEQLGCSRIDHPVAGHHFGDAAAQKCPRQTPRIKQPFSFGSILGGTSRENCQAKIVKGHL